MSRDAPKTLTDLPAGLQADVEGFLDRKAPATQRAYLRDLLDFVAATGVSDVAEITHLELVRYDATLERAELAPATIRRRLHVLKALLTHAFDLGRVERNVGSAKRVPKAIPTGRDRVLLETQVWMLFDRCQNERDRMVCRLLYYSGARVAEVARMTWGDITDDGKGHGLIAIMGKGDKPREVLVHAFVFAELVRFRGSADPARSVFGLTDRSLRRIVTAAGRRARIPGAISPHWLRHAHGTHASEHRAPIAVIQHSLGHESAATTLGYLHPKPGDGSGLYLPAI